MTFKLLFMTLTSVLLATAAAAQTPASSIQPAPQNNASGAAAQDDDADRDVNLAQPDFNLAALPTTLRVPRFGSSFRITHRFARPLGAGDLGDLVEDLFGLDSGAIIGLEYRFGLWRGVQVGIHRTSGRTIQFFGQYELKNQRDGFPLGLAAYATAEGADNFRENRSPGIGLLVSREIGDRAALYVEPFWVNNTNPLPKELVDDNNTVIMGVGARVRIRPTVYLLFEAAPRLTGYAPEGNVDHLSFAIEKRSGGHNFQLNFSNGFGTTLADIARGSGSNDDWYLGFNISRKFF